MIDGDPWTWPEDPDNNQAARQLAIRLLDSGAVDLAVVGPDWAEQARALAEDWSFVTDSQWLFFAPLPAETSPERTMRVRLPELGKHRALIQADYARLATHLRDEVEGVLEPSDPRERPSGDVARIQTLAGNPRLWAGPKVEQGPAGIDFVRVCPGTFTMGSPRDHPDTPEDRRPYDAELPAHPVILDAFEIARTELTGAQFARLTGETRPAAPDDPVAGIDWNDARAVCGRIAPKGGLPTEAQWEYAARGGAQTAWSWGDDPERAGDFAWYLDNSNRASRVGGKRPNPLGLHDMHGNVWEWVRDCYDDGAYGDRGPDPTAEPVEEGSGCGLRVLRGGSFDLEPRSLRSAVRGRDRPRVQATTPSGSGACVVRSASRTIDGCPVEQLIDNPTVRVSSLFARSATAPQAAHVVKQSHTISS